MADESAITFELGRHVSDIIGLIERNTCQCDFIRFRLDWLYNAVVRYCDNIPSGEAVMALIQEATGLLRPSEGDGFSQNFSFQAEIIATGERGRPRFIISRDQLTFLLDFAERQSALQQKKKTRKQILPFVTTYHSSVCNLKNILMQNWNLIQNQPLLKSILKSRQLYPTRKDNLLRTCSLGQKYKAAFIKMYTT